MTDDVTEAWRESRQVDIEEAGPADEECTCLKILLTKWAEVLAVRPGLCWRRHERCEAVASLLGYAERAVRRLRMSRGLRDCYECS